MSNEAVELKDGKITFYASNRKAWRDWLTKNSGRETSVWLIIYRKTADKPSITYEEAVEEALCFGWIDSKPNKRDADSYYQFFARRKPKSGWSKVNKDRVKALCKQGLMTPSGEAAIEVAKANGAWSSLDSIERGELPEDLTIALAKNEMAKGYFDAFPKSVKRGILEWIQSAKRPETRAKRVGETVTLAARNERANQYKPKA